MNEYENFLRLFGVTEEEIKKVINIALSNGGNYADIYFEYTVSNELGLNDSQVNAAGHHIDYGVGIRVVSGEKTGYAYSEIISMKEMEAAAKTAAKIAKNNIGNIGPINIDILKGNDYYPIVKKLDGYAIKDKLPYLYELDKKLRNADPRIESVLAKLSDADTKILFFNSLGNTYTDHRPMISFAVSCVAKENGRSESGGCSKSYRKGFEMLSSELIDEMVDETVKKISILFKAKQPDGGVMPVVMGAGSSGILLHEAMGHAFEADFNRKETSIFCNKMGKSICNKNINIVDDGTVQNNRGSINYDDEGVRGQKTYMVKDGILNSYLHDRISASYYGVAPTGNGRRESFKFPPIPRMRLTYMENGTALEADIISSVKKGIYVDNFSNGQVNIGAGDFTFYVRSGYLIENGKLTQPIKDFNIIGNGPQALADIVAIGNNFKIENSPWTCGKEQYCPVSCGMPSVLVRQLTVGGNA